MGYLVRKIEPHLENFPSQTPMQIGDYLKRRGMFRSETTTGTAVFLGYEDLGSREKDLVIRVTQDPDVFREVFQTRYITASGLVDSYLEQVRRFTHSAFVAQRKRYRYKGVIPLGDSHLSQEIQNPLNRELDFTEACDHAFLRALFGADLTETYLRLEENPDNNRFVQATRGSIKHGAMIRFDEPFQYHGEGHIAGLVTVRSENRIPIISFQWYFDNSIDQMLFHL